MGYATPLNWPTSSTFLKNCRAMSFFGEQVSEKLIYYPTVTRESYGNQGRLTDLMTTGKLFTDIGLPDMSTEHDRFMICPKSEHAERHLRHSGCAWF